MNNCVKHSVVCWLRAVLFNYDFHLIMIFNYASVWTLLNEWKLPTLHHAFLSYLLPLTIIVVNSYVCVLGWSVFSFFLFLLLVQKSCALVRKHYRQNYLELRLFLEMLQKAFNLVMAINGKNESFSVATISHYFFMKIISNLILSIPKTMKSIIT